MPHRRPWLFVMSGSLLGCAGETDLGCPRGFLADAYGGCVFDEDSVIALIQDMDGGALEKMNDVPFEQVAGVPLVRNVWASAVPVEGFDAVTSLDLYRHLDPTDSQSGTPVPFPVGSLFIHETVNREEGHTVQVKRDDYEDENGRPWWTGKYFDDGTMDTNECSPCSMCHNEGTRPNSEGLMGVPPDHAAW